MADVSGGDALEAALRRIGNSLARGREVRVGFLENADYPDGMSVATVAAINNFGAPGAGIPPRPFFSDMVAEKSPEWGNKFAGVLAAADYDTRSALELMGQGIAGQLRQAIVDFDSPANSPVTDLLKQRFPTRDGMTFGDVLDAREDVEDVEAGVSAPAGKPLVWSGHMLNSVDSEVTD